MRSQLGFIGIAFGAAEDIPQPADYDGDGKADVGFSARQMALGICKEVN